MHSSQHLNCCSTNNSAIGDSSQMANTNTDNNSNTVNNNNNDNSKIVATTVAVGEQSNSNRISGNKTVANCVIMNNQLMNDNNNKFEHDPSKAVATTVMGSNDVVVAGKNVNCNTHNNHTRGNVSKLNKCVDEKREQEHEHELNLLTTTTTPEAIQLEKQCDANRLSHLSSLSLNDTFADNCDNAATTTTTTRVLNDKNLLEKEVKDNSSQLILTSRPEHNRCKIDSDDDDDKTLRPVDSATSVDSIQTTNLNETTLATSSFYSHSGQMEERLNERRQATSNHQQHLVTDTTNRDTSVCASCCCCCLSRVINNNSGNSFSTCSADHQAQTSRQSTVSLDCSSDCSLSSCRRDYDCDDITTTPINNNYTHTNNDNSCGSSNRSSSSSSSSSGSSGRYTIGRSYNKLMGQQNYAYVNHESMSADIDSCQQLTGSCQLAAPDTACPLVRSYRSSTRPHNINNNNNSNTSAIADATQTTTCRYKSLGASTKSMIITNDNEYCDNNKQNKSSSSSSSSTLSNLHNHHHHHQHCHSFALGDESYSSSHASYLGSLSPLMGGNKSMSSLAPTTNMIMLMNVRQLLQKTSAIQGSKTLPSNVNDDKKSKFTDDGSHQQNNSEQQRGLWFKLALKERKFLWKSSNNLKKSSTLNSDDPLNDDELHHRVANRESPPFLDCGNTSGKYDHCCPMGKNGEMRENFDRNEVTIASDGDALRQQQQQDPQLVISFNDDDSITNSSQLQLRQSKRNREKGATCEPIISQSPSCCLMLSDKQQQCADNNQLVTKSQNFLLAAERPNIVDTISKANTSRQQHQSEGHENTGKLLYILYIVILFIVER